MNGPLATPLAPTPAASAPSTPASSTRPVLQQLQLAPPASPASLRTTAAAASSTSPPRPERTALDSGRKLARNVSPGLLARMKFLNQNQDTSRNPASSQIGRISESKIRELDDFHRDRTVRIERRGTAWSGTASQAATPLIPQLTGESVPALAMDHSPPPGFESDRSSFVSTSDKVLPSDSEAGDTLGEDTQKYRLPDLTKTKSLSQTIAESDTTTTTTTTTTPELARPPTPPPKDTPPAEEVSVLDADNAIDVEAYFQRRHFSRANSIYTLSRASFTNQILQLTSIKLPPPESLSSEISALPSSTAAGRALHSAANSIKLWMAKAAEVLNGLDAEDDVEWAAAAGREGLAEVDAAIGKFEGLVNVYITAIEDLQARPDIATLPTRDLTTLVTQMEDVVGSWSKIKQTLKGIKSQVEIAMEWEELWNIVLGEIGLEIENLSRHVFEMEERRHRAISDSVAESAEKFDIAELETIVEETPRQQARLQSNRFSMPPALSVMSPVSPIPQIEQENSRLLALFAKLQPLRASLDFLPMRLSSFHIRASNMFPSACDELMRRKDQLEKMEKKLEADADALREELGEDKWVHSFRQAGSKAIAMYDSLMKSIQRLRQAIDEGDDEKLSSRISTYKDKREHYPPSMKRVLELIDIEMKHRSTVNGEILRIQQDVRQKVSDLETETKEMDVLLEEVTSTRKLRDSVSTVLSARTEASLAGSTLDTPNSSPASSIIISRKSSDHGTITPVGKKARQPSASSSKPSIPANRRYSSLPTATSTVSRKPLTASRLETVSSANPPRAMTSTPTRSARSSTPGSDTASAKPRWNGSTNMRDTVVGHNFKPLTLTTPSPHRKVPPTPVRSLRSVSSHSAIPVRSPLARTTALSPPPGGRPSSTTPAQQPKARRPLASPMQSPSTPARAKALTQSTPGSSVSVSTPASTRRVQIVEEDESEESPIARRATRPSSAMNSRRSSMLPTPKQRTVSGSSIPSVATPGHRSSSRLGSIDEGRKSRSGMTTYGNGRTSQMGGRKSSLDEKSRWRG
ncbi:KAR9-domain-containing protein [Trematosphaeria pertusa]|uniref:KAR9-domain-containing protein n=1 Tax=Trematosphaeria pertusa TaxID=390896 RepID=A0A6A6HR28_9PLEO|nr:KAR9-domain-containing protein [Trematosphaeria pertusa]KAF2240566.1 KAR9-domain-containing protein [Trematosphaeria pertusa]